MSRSLESRIGRLEQSSGIRDPNRVFVMWCRPDQDEDAVLQAAADQGLFGTNEKRMVECCHWKGSGPIPKPRWTFDSVIVAPRSSAGGIERAIASARSRSSPVRESDTVRSQNASEWRNYSFDKLKKVQILRFVELCEQYGYGGGSGSRIAPIDEWEMDDREELTELHDIAASEPY